MQSQSIPAVMTGINHWVVWRYEEREGKRTKVPYCVATGKRASTTEPADWTVYEAALACSKRYDGIGFVFNTDDPLVGIDLDGCRDGETGVIQDWARAIIGLLDSYTEVTPSGTGVHILCRGHLPPGGRRKGKVEIYETGRYFTVTGERLEERPREPEERSEALLVFHDSVFGEPREPARPANGRAAILPDQWKIIEQVLRHPDGAPLWRGENLNHPSDSEADWDLCGLVAWFAGPDAALIESVVRQSNRQREKWDTPRGAATWIGQTIANRLRTKMRFFDWSRPATEQRYEPTAYQEPEDNPFVVLGRFVVGRKQNRVAPVALEPEALYGLPGEVVSTIDPHTESHPAAVLASFITGMGCLIGRSPHIYRDGGRQTVNEFAVLVGLTAVPPDLPATGPHSNCPARPT